MNPKFRFCSYWRISSFVYLQNGCNVEQRCVMSNLKPGADTITRTCSFSNKSLALGFGTRSLSGEVVDLTKDNLSAESISVDVKETELTIQSSEKKKICKEVIDLTQDDPAIISVVKQRKELSTSYQSNTVSNTGLLPPTTTMVNSLPSTLLRGKGFGEIFKRTSSPVMTLAAGPLSPKRHQHSGGESPKRVAQDLCSLPEAPIKRVKNIPIHKQYQHHYQTKLQQDVLPGRSTPKQKFYPTLGNSPREWELTTFGQKYCRQQVKTPGMEFSIMSYNILAQDLLDDNRHLYEGYSEEVLQWENRRDKLVAEIEFYKPDIMCLQEVNCNHYAEFFVPKLKELGYHGVYKQRTGGKLDGCAIIYKESRFLREEITGVEYLQRPHPVLDRDNVGVIIKLKPKEGKSDSSLCIANTHLLYNPGRGDIKLAQLVLLLAELDKLSHAADKQTTAEAYTPVIVCGDFNSTPASNIYRFLTKGYLHYENLLAGRLSGQRPDCRRNRVIVKNFFPRELGISDQCQYVDLSFQRTCAAQATEQSSQSLPPSSDFTSDELGHSQGENEDSGVRNPLITQNSGYLWHHLNLESAYSHRIKRLGYKEREVTTQHSQGGCIVDYILYNVLENSKYTKNTRAPAREGQLKLIGKLGLLSAEEIEEMGNLPNNVNPSDHLPLLARFLLE